MIDSQDTIMISSMSSRETNSSIVEKSKKIEILVISGCNNVSKITDIFNSLGNSYTHTDDYIKKISSDTAYWNVFDYDRVHKEDCDSEYEFLWIFIDRLNKFLRRRLYFENLKHINTYSFRSSIPKLIKVGS